MPGTLEPVIENCRRGGQRLPTEGAKQGKGGAVQDGGGGGERYVPAGGDDSQPATKAIVFFLR